MFGEMQMERPEALRKQFYCAFVMAVVLALAPVDIASANAPPKYDHIVVVVMENHSLEQILSAPAARYLQRLAQHGALFTDSHGVAHPSQPNYLALFSGSTHGVRDDGTHEFAAPNLAARLRAAGRTFVGYVEDGSPRKHNPWESFNDARKFERSLATFPLRYENLPDVCFVIPSLPNDMHDGTIGKADDWLKAHLGTYAIWSRTHNSLLIVTFDEDDYGLENRIFTVLVGARIRPGRYAQNIDHYTLLRTIEEIEGISPLGASVIKSPIVGTWKSR